MKKDSEKGMMTVEVIIGITIYCAFFVLLLNLINVIYIKQKMQAVMRPIALQISREYRVNRLLAEKDSCGASDMFIELQELYLDAYRTTAYIPGADLKANARDLFYIHTLERTEDGGISNSYFNHIGIYRGFAGIDFSETTIDENGDGEVNLVLKYKIRIVSLPLFEDAGIDIDIKQTASTLIW